MNMMVSGMTGKPPLYIATSASYNGSLVDYGTPLNGTQASGISAKAGHVSARSTCLWDLAGLWHEEGSGHFGTTPLRLETLRASRFLGMEQISKRAFNLSVGESALEGGSEAAAAVDVLSRSDALGAVHFAGAG